MASAPYFLLLVFLISNVAAATARQTVDLGYATYEGIFNSTTGVTSFLGMHYASPPTGKLRFQAPTTPAQLKGVQPATEFGAQCNQAGMGSMPTDPGFMTNLTKRQTVASSEDCLFIEKVTLLLRVYTPGKIGSAKDLPVVFFIHGGGYAGGNAQMDGTDLIKDAGGDVVAVLIQYRLGVFGFLAGSKMKEKGALNAGLLDQEFALKWVQQHIHSFGGDRSKVTIWGQSAGAGSVLQQMVAHGGNTQPPLFRAGMTSSVFLPPQFNFNDEVPERIFQTTAQQTGCATSADVFSCLVDVDLNTLQNANADISLSDFFGLFAYVPVVDGEFIQESPTKAMLVGKMNGDVLLTVNNAFEGNNFVSPAFTVRQTLAQYVELLFPNFDSELISATVAQYSGLENGNVTEQAFLIMGESIFVCPSYAMMQGFEKSSFRAQYAIPPATHGADRGIYFQLNAAATPIDASFAGSFLSIVKTLDPNYNPLNKSVTPFWSTYLPGNTEMRFNITENGAANVTTFHTDKGLLERCAFWRSISDISPQ